MEFVFDAGILKKLDAALLGSVKTLVASSTTNGGEQKMDINHLHYRAHQHQLKLHQVVLFQEIVNLFTEERIGLQLIVMVHLE